jgi:hypothetical protein
MAKLLRVPIDAQVTAPQSASAPYEPPAGLLESAQNAASAGAPTSNTEAAEADPDAALFDVAQRLWSPAMVGVLQQQLASDAAIDESSGQQPALSLLGTTPLAEARQALMQYMEQNPGAAEAVGSAGLTGSQVCDPAVLVMLKSGYLTVAGRSSRRRSTRGSAAATEDGSQESPETAWQQAANGFVEQWYQRLQAAAADAPPADAQSLAQLPIRLATNLNVTAQYHLQLPADAPAELSGVAVAPLKLHYVRVEQEERPARLMAPIRRQVNRTIYNNEGSTITVDGLDRGSQPGTLLSVDLRLTLTGSDSSQINLPQPLVMELLIVEIPDPNPPEAEPES